MFEIRLVNVFCAFFCINAGVCFKHRVKRTSEEIVINEMTVNAKSMLRFADVNVSCEMENIDAELSKEASFEVRIPKNAFITSFIMSLPEKDIEAEIMPKETAQEVYTEAILNGSSAGLVSRSNIVDEFDREVFDIVVTIQPRAKITFHLQYQELIERKAGKYIQKIYISQKTPVTNTTIIYEAQELDSFQRFRYTTPDGHTFSDDLDTKSNVNGYNTKRLRWSPSTRISLSTLQTKPFHIEYELKPSETGGIMYTNEYGDFAHIFQTTCVEENVMRKVIMFVIDTSGSMKGEPTEQVKKAMYAIISKLRPGDRFTFLTFSVSSTIWRNTFVQATEGNKTAAIRDINQITAQGGTNIHDALMAGLQLFRDSKVNTRTSQAMIILSDGEANTGVTNKDTILARVRNLNSQEDGEYVMAKITSIAFGISADITFLDRLAVQNGGKLIRIRNNGQSDESVEFTYDTVANPTLKDVSFMYFFSEEGTKKPIPHSNLTQTKYDQIDCGDEIIIGGWTDRPGDDLLIEAEVEGIGVNENVFYSAVSKFSARGVQGRFLERLVAYKQIKTLINSIAKAQTDTEKDKFKLQATQLALEHKFVTPFTSLVVHDIKKAELSGSAKTRDRVDRFQLSAFASMSTRQGLRSSMSKLSTTNVPTLDSIGSDVTAVTKNVKDPLLVDSDNGKMAELRNKAPSLYPSCYNFIVILLIVCKVFGFK